MYTSQKPVDIGQILGVLQRMAGGVASQAGYLGDEFPVDLPPP